MSKLHHTHTLNEVNDAECAPDNQLELESRHEDIGNEFGDNTQNLVADPLNLQSQNIGLHDVPEVQLSNPDEQQKTQTVTSNEQNETECEILESEILNVIGKRVAEDRELAPMIYKDIAVRWSDILKMGIPKEEKELLIKKYPPPKNCVTINPPKLNEKIKVSLQEAMIKRDSRIIEKQQKVSASLALLGKALSYVIKESPEKLALVEVLSDAGRLLSDLQRDESLTRKSLALSNVSTSHKTILEESIPDEWLFGKDLADRLKTAKTIERSSQNFKSKAQNSVKSKNLKGPSRRFPFCPTMTGGQKQFGKQIQYPRKSWGNRNPSSQYPNAQKKN